MYYTAALVEPTFLNGSSVALFLLFSVIFFCATVAFAASWMFDSAQSTLVFMTVMIASAFGVLLVNGHAERTTPLNEKTSATISYLGEKVEPYGKTSRMASYTEYIVDDTGERIVFPVSAGYPIHDKIVVYRQKQK